MQENHFRFNYPVWDKALHYLAFHSTGLQRKLAELESQEHLAKLQPLRVQKAVFVLGLPRSGTTLLLNLLSKTSEFCYQTYGDMPFVLTPLLWSRFRMRFGRPIPSQERVHGDGINVSLEAPEALEEMLFKTWYPKRYSLAYLSESDDIYSEPFTCFFKKHICKLMLRDKKTRYLSKNNANISRVRYLRQSFPDADIIVMYRNPLHQAMSLLRQHKNFTELHRAKPFTADYMAATGHFDFGINLKPVNFDGWAQRTKFQPDDINYWLAYWTACYQHLCNINANIHFICYESLCERPETQLSDIAQTIGIAQSTLLEQVAFIKPHVQSSFQSDYHAEPSLLNQAQQLYQELSVRASC